MDTAAIIRILLFLVFLRAVIFIWRIIGDFQEAMLGIFVLGLVLTFVITFILYPLYIAITSSWGGLAVAIIIVLFMLFLFALFPE